MFIIADLPKCSNFVKHLVVFISMQLGSVSNMDFDEFSTGFDKFMTSLYCFFHFASKVD